MSLILPGIGSNLVTGQAPFDSTLIEKSVWLDGSADGFTRSASDFDNEDGKEFTLGTWFQLNQIGVSEGLFYAGNPSPYTSLRHDDDNKIYFQTEAGSAILKTQAVFRDIGWYHVLVSVDTTQSVAGNRVRLFVNGTEQTLDGTQPSVNHAYEFNTAVVHEVGDSHENGAFKGYLAQSFMIGSKSIQQGDFAITDFLDTYTFGTNGSQFIPKKHSEIKTLVDAGSDNSFLLDYEPADPTASNALGLDISSYGNNFTSTSMGSANQSVHTPSKVYPTLNPLAQNSTGVTLSQGNLGVARSSSSQGLISSTMGMTSGKYYCEVTINDEFNLVVGLIEGVLLSTANRYLGQDSNTYGYDQGGNVVNGGTGSSYGTAYNNGDVVGIIFDADNGKLYFSKNGTIQNSGDTGNGTGFAFENLTNGPYFFGVSVENVSTANVFNFGQSSFAHTPPTDFVALNSANLTAPDYQGIDYFDATLYEGNGTGQRVGDFVPFTDAYTVDNSAMFEHDDARYLSRTIEAPSSSGGKKGTWSVWFKTANIDTDNIFFDNGTTATNRFSLNMDASGQIIFSHKGIVILKTGASSPSYTADFKGDGAWHNVVLKVDTAQPTASNRAAMFIDGVEQTDFEEDRRDNSNFSQNDEIGYMDEGATQFVGSYNGSSDNQWDGYLAEVVFLDDEFLDASSFGQVDTSTNRWVPKSVSGLTFGDCGFYLEFETAPNLGTLIAQGTGTPIGNMTAGGGLAAAFDGDIENYNAGAQANATSGNIGKDFGSSVTKTITGVVVKMLGNVTIDGGAAAETMTLTVQRSDNGTDFTTVYTESGISVAAGAIVTRRDGFTNTAAARYARISVSHSGGAETHISELEFYEGGSAGIGTDSSGNGNNFTQGGSWAASDQFTDTPSQNFAIMDFYHPDSSTATTFSEGNLKVSMGTAAGDGARGTLAYNGKMYWEVELDAISTNSGSDIGIATRNHNLALTSNNSSNTNAFLGVSSFDSNLKGFFANAAVDTSYGGLGNNFGTAGKYLMFAVDTDAGKFWAGYDGTWFGSGNPAAGTNDSGQDISLYDTWFPAISRIGSVGSGAFIFNFGQRSFAHTPPTGFSKLNQDNIDDTASKITAFAWIKNRDATDNHILVDRVRGIGKDLHSNSDPSIGDIAPAEVTNPNTVQRFLQRGVQIGSDVEVNTVNESYVLWQWLVGDSATTGTAISADSPPSLASTSLVADAGHLAIISYTGNATSGATIGHGMSAAPEMIWVKERDNANGWIVSTTDIGFNKVVRLDATAEEGVDGGAFNSTAPTSTLITLGSNSGTNRSGGKMICYAFRSVPGVCKFGTYIGNGDGTGSDTVDGPYVSCGFRPRWILFKWLSGGSLSAEGWVLKDTARQTVNPNDDADLIPNGSNAEAAGATHGADILSDGFKIRGGGGAVNKSGAKYLYVAMADIGGNGTFPPIYGR